MRKLFAIIGMFGLALGQLNVPAPSPVSVTVALPAGTNVIGHVIADSGSTMAVTSLPATPTGTNTIGSVKKTDGTNTAIVDPCQGQTPVFTLINVTAGATLITGTSAKRTYICSIELLTATAQNIAIVEGTGTVCATSILGLMTGPAAATGWNFAANGGLTFGNGGYALAETTVNANNVCILTSSSGQISGVIRSVVQ